MGWLKTHKNTISSSPLICWACKLLLPFYVSVVFFCLPASTAARTCVKGSGWTQRLLRGIEEIRGSSPAKSLGDPQPVCSENLELACFLTLCISWVFKQGLTLTRYDWGDGTSLVLTGSNREHGVTNYVKYKPLPWKKSHGQKKKIKGFFKINPNISHNFTQINNHNFSVWICYFLKDQNSGTNRNLLSGSWK